MATNVEVKGLATPRLDELRAVFATRFGLFGDAVDRAAACFGAPWTAEFERTLQHLCPSRGAIERAAAGYSAFALDVIRRQRKFESDHAYPTKSYDEAAAEVYFDDEFMMSEYLPGLLLSHFLWPHHYRQAQFFDGAFVTAMEAAGGERFVEVGVGTGLYSRRLLDRLPNVRGTGIDVSPAAKDFAEAHLRAFDLADRYEMLLRDLSVESISPCAWLVCVEVLEHLESPVEFLQCLRATLADGGRAFITAAINAPNADHIYLYETVDQVLGHLERAGFVAEQGFFAPAYPPRRPDAPVPTVAAFIVA